MQSLREKNGGYVLNPGFTPYDAIAELQQHAKAHGGMRCFVVDTSRISVTVQVSAETDPQRLAKDVWRAERDLITPIVGPTYSNPSDEALRLEEEILRLMGDTAHDWRERIANLTAARFGLQ